jgi:hypothetical protein
LNAYQESYEDFNNVPVRVWLLDETQLTAREALYKLNCSELEITSRKANGQGHVKSVEAVLRP